MDLVWYPWDPGQPGRGKRRRSFQELANELSRLFLKTVAAVVPRPTDRQWFSLDACGCAPRFGGYWIQATMLKNGWQMAASPQSDVFLFVRFFVVVFLRRCCRTEKNFCRNTCTLKKLRLTFNGHIASLASSLLPTLVHINRVRHLFAKDVLYIILNSVVFSKLFYCSTVWSGTSKENIHKLQLMQNFVGRILSNTKKFYHITPVLHELGWLTIEELVCLLDVPMIFKCLNGLVPNYLSTKFVKRSETHSYCTHSYC